MSKYVTDGRVGMSGGEYAAWWTIILLTCGLAWPFYAMRKRQANRTWHVESGYAEAPARPVNNWAQAGRNIRDMRAAFRKDE
jgi:hypothetical protein